MIQSPIWPGSASFEEGMTPFGLYDDDDHFAQDAPRVARWCAIRLGYPITNVELSAVNFFTCFEEAVSEYSSQVNQFNIRNNLDLLRGQPNNTNFTGKYVQGTNVQDTIRISDSYGTLVGVGGDVDIKKGYVDMIADQQVYDLQELWGDVNEDGKRIDVYRVFYEGPPAIQRFFDPFAMSGVGAMNMMDQFGFGGFTPAVQFMLMPIYNDLLRIQAIEFNDQIRKSAHTFSIVNNKLRIFPVPRENKKLWFEYMVRDDLIQGSVTIGDSMNQVSDYSNIRYDFIPYFRINDVGKQWIRKYTLAVAKELLGAIREKYSTIPIPGSEISLDGGALRAEASAEKDALITELRENLEELSRRNQFEKKAAEAQQLQEVLQKVPLAIYIG